MTISLNKTHKQPKRFLNKLRSKQQLFAQFYVKHFNATQAAKDAGYSEKRAGRKAYELLKNPLIQDYVEQLKREQLANVTVSKEYLNADLEYWKTKAKELGNIQAGIRVVEVQAKLNGLMVERHEHKVASIVVNILDADVVPVSTSKNNNIDGGGQPDE